MEIPILSANSPHLLGLPLPLRSTIYHLLLPASPAPYRIRLPTCVELNIRRAPSSRDTHTHSQDHTPSSITRDIATLTALLRLAQTCYTLHAEIMPLLLPCLWVEAPNMNAACMFAAAHPNFARQVQAMELVYYLSVRGSAEVQKRWLERLLGWYSGLRVLKYPEIRVSGEGKERRVEGKGAEVCRFVLERVVGGMDCVAVLRRGYGGVYFGKADRLLGGLRRSAVKEYLLESYEGNRVEVVDVDGELDRISPGATGPLGPKEDGIEISERGSFISECREKTGVSKSNDSV